MIDHSPEKFKTVDATVEEIQFVYLLHYPTYDIKHNRKIVFQTLQEAMDAISQSRTFLAAELDKEPGFQRLDRKIELRFGDEINDHGFFLVVKTEKITFFYRSKHCFCRKEVDIFEKWKRRCKVGLHSKSGPSQILGFFG